MDIPENIPSNSISSQIDREKQLASYKEKEAKKEEYKKRVLEKTNGKISGKTSKQKPTKEFWGKFVSTTASDMKNYIVDEVLIPSLKRFVSEGSRNIVDKALYGSVRGGPTPNGGTNYNQYYAPPYRAPTAAPVQYIAQPVVQQPAPSTGAFENISFPTRSQAQYVKDQITEMIKRYDVATVNDLYDLARVPAPYTADRYGWFDAECFDVVPLPDGRFELRMGPVVPVKR